MRRRYSPTSSFELFLDTICNTFGGILFIAILIAIQIRHTEKRIEVPTESASPEKIAELQQILDHTTSEIESAKDIQEMIRKTLQEPTNEEERNLANRYNELAEIKTKKLAEKTELANKYLELIQQNELLEQKIKDIENILQQYEIEEQNLEIAVQKTKMNNARAERDIAELQSNIDDLNRKMLQKEGKAKEKKTTTRKEKISLTTLHDSDNKRSIGFMLRYNKLYVIADYRDFDFRTEKFIGQPKRNKGIPLHDNEECRRKITNLLRYYSPNITYVTVITYGDSFERFYLFRDVVAENDFEISIKPSNDDAIWIWDSHQQESVQ
ncbi:MAG: hypothetical protein LBI18_06120 [Planctomycetaceae bacterium]|jgi:hypothetical protein|nr:hypothetical protein [Planctomycetaceae bacterium]